MNTSSTRLRKLLVIIGLASALSGISLNPVAALASAEDEMKAAFVFYLAKFVDWPDAAFTDDSAPLTLCILGNSVAGESFAQLQGKTVKQRAVQVKSLTRTENLTGCHITFLGPPTSAQESSLSMIPHQQGMLTISDSLANFAQYGIVANLIFVDNRIKLELNNKAVQNAGLTISSQVLRLAKVVDTVQ